MRRGWAHACVAIGCIALILGCGTVSRTRPAIAAPLRPDAAACELAIREDVASAIAVRRILGIDGVDASTNAAEAAAANGSIDAGVPLLAREATALVASGATMPDTLVLMSGLVLAHGDVFGDTYLVGPTLVVSISDPDDPRFEQARCRESGPYKDAVRYVEAGPTSEDLDAILASVVADRSTLIEGGMEFTTAWTDVPAGKVVVGLRHVKPGDQERLIQRYGSAVTVIEHQGFEQAP